MITRNRFKNDQGAFWMGVPVWKKGRGLMRINEVEVCHEGRWKDKHLQSICHAYGNAPYFREYLPLFERVFSDAYEKISDLNRDIITCAARALGIRARILRLSETGVQGSGTELLVRLCAALGADRFLAFSPAGKFLDGELFAREGIELMFLDIPSIVYPQLWGGFVPNLSAFDLLMNCGPKSREILERGTRGPRSME